MTKTSALTTFALLIGAVPAWAPAWAQTPSANDAEFVTKATVGNSFEIEESQLALQRATDPKLKAFAQRMIDDHTAALKKLEAATGKPATGTDLTLDQPHQAMLDNLKTFNGADFDKIYTADQVASHAETVALLSDYYQNGKNSALKSWARQSLPVVKGHRNDIDAMPS